MWEGDTLEERSPSPCDTSCDGSDRHDNQAPASKAGPKGTEMTDQITRRPTADISQRKVALIAGLGLLGMALLAPFALLGVLPNLVVPADAAATVNNFIASEGLFRIAIAAVLIVTMLDILVAWALYVLLRPVNRTVALLVGWLRLVAAAAFLAALTNLLDVAQLLGGAERSALQPEQVQAQVMASIASFDNGWDIMLAIFGLHLLGLGYLLFRSADFPRFLGVLVVIAGGGYLADTFTRILIPDFVFTFSVFTFIGEPLLIVWLFYRAIKGFNPSAGASMSTDPDDGVLTGVEQPAAVVPSNGRVPSKV
jgi:hypothetical protein